MTTWLMALGIGIAIASFAALLWSILCPSRRIWPPVQYSAATPFFVWTPTLTLFAILITLGALEWGELGIADLVRFGVGPALILIGNVAVWSEVKHFGMRQTGGDVGRLRTSGLYRFSRNPQYVADILMIIGWVLLSASGAAGMVGLCMTVLLLTAPFAEEPWLRDRYGQDFEDYAKKVRRFV